MSDDRFFERLAAAADLQSGSGSPATLKSRIYTALIRRQSETGPLMSLSETAGGLCVFEKLVTISPVGESAKCLNCCTVCHARLIAERFENAPLYWKHCPYAGFQNR